MAKGKGGSITRVLSSKAYYEYEKRLLKEVKQRKAPEHLAIIMDGNRRFAREIGLTRVDGHEKGRNKLEELLTWGLELDIKILTVYAFSTENLARDEKEVVELMDLFEESFYKAAEDKRVHENRISIKVLGQTSILPERVQKAIAHAEEKTKKYKCSIGQAELSDVAVKVKPMPGKFISKDGFYVTRAFINYAAPLVGKLPEYVRLEGVAPGTTRS